MFLGHVIRLRPTVKQEVFFRKSCGTARFAYNWALAEWNRQYEVGKSPDSYALQKKLVAIKDVEFPWMREVAAVPAGNAILALGIAFKNFFRHLKTGEKPGYPKFKRKGVRERFSPWNMDNIRVDGSRVFIPKLGWVKMRQPLRFEGRFVEGVISERAGVWFLSITVETEVSKEKTGDAVIGIDLGCKELAVTSDGERFVGPKPYRRLQGKLARLSRSLSRKEKGSQNRAKAKRKVARLHLRIANVRSAYLHETTTKLVLRSSAIVVEDLNVEAMMKFGLGKSLNDQSLGTFRRQLAYKCELYGTTLHIADRFFASSKTCSGCGNKKSDLLMKDRVYRCDICGLEVCRDLNAAINLREQIPVLDRELTPAESSPLGSR